jgi:hypothetical protein
VRPPLGQHGEPVLDLGTQQPVRVGLAVHQVPHADDGLGSPLPAVQQSCRRGVVQGDPGDHAGDLGVGPGDPEHVGGVVEVVRRLDQHGRADAHLGLLGHDVVVVERPAQAVQRRGHPRVVRPRRVPDMLVGVDRGRRDLGHQPCLVVAPPPLASRASPAKTAFSRSKAVPRCVTMAVLAVSGSRSLIARAIARCSGLVAAACPAWW